MIKRSILLASLVSLVALNTAFAQSGETITTKAATTTVAAATDAADIQTAGSSFIQRINYARVALAMDNVQLAKQHITEAQKLLGKIRASNPEQLRMANIGAGRVSYKDNERKFYYPVETGPIVIEKTAQGPLLNRKALAVTDAEIAYVTLDFRDNAADKLLAKSLQKIDANNLKGAQTDLGNLMDKVVDTNSTSVSVPLDRARDNIALARSFIAMEDYDSARFALKHANQALDEMSKDKQYEQRKSALGTLQREVESLQTTVQKNDPSAWHKADEKLKQWWGDLKGWANK